MSGLMEELQRKYTQETDPIKNLSQQNCMLMKKSIKKPETQLKT